MPKPVRRLKKPKSVKKRPNVQKHKKSLKKGKIVKKSPRLSSAGKKKKGVSLKTKGGIKGFLGKKKKTAKKVPARRKKEKGESKEVCIGEITHYFSRIQVVVLKMTQGRLLVGENIHIKGKKTDFVQKVQSLQIESVDVKSANKGQLAGLKVSKKATPGDKVLKLK